MLVVVALGGNAFNRPGDPITQETHLKNADIAARIVAKIIQEGNQVLLTHGNGPQVGYLAELQKGQEGFRLDALVAATQGLLGYFIVSSVDKYVGVGKTVALVTRVKVNCNDPAFENPTKFIGPTYPEEVAKSLAERYGWQFRQDPRGGWRRVVSSPKPLKVVESDVIKALVERGYIVVAAGGGGVPVCDGAGVEAVIDKDLASAVLAAEVGADLFMILTDVDGVYINFKKPGQRKLTSVSVGELEKYYLEGHFPPGSMGPKVEAALYFVKRTGKRAAIGALEEGYEVYKGLSGTQIYA